jgi:hypothetical protein
MTIEDYDYEKMFFSIIDLKQVDIINLRSTSTLLLFKQVL